MDFDFSVITDHLSFLGSGIAITLLLSVLSGTTSLIAGFFVALFRLYGPRWLKPLVVLYITDGCNSRWSRGRRAV